jgi:hypothetical protein
MLRRVAIIRTDVLEEPIASIIRVTRIGRLGKSAVTSKRSTLLLLTFCPRSPILLTLMMEAVCSSETPVVTRATLRYIPDDEILQSLL